MAREMQVVQHVMGEHEHQIDAAAKQFSRMHSRLEHVVAVNNEAIVVRSGKARLRPAIPSMGNGNTSCSLMF